MAGFNDILEKGTKGIGDIAGQISSSQFFKNVVPTAEGFGQELSAQISSNQKVKISYLQDRLANAVGAAADRPLVKAGLSPDEIKAVNEQLAQALKGSDYSDAALDTLSGIMSKHNIDDATFAKFKKLASKNISDTLNTASVTIEKATLTEGMLHPLRYASTYFNNPDKTIKKQRIAAVAGTYAGVAVGARALSGGNLTHDEYGQRDIAGVPFI